MSRSAKKEQEIHVLEEAKVLIEDFPPEKILEFESPDFLIHTNRNGTIGIEITEFNKKDPRTQTSRARAEQALHSRLAQRAKQEFESRNAVRLQVTFASQVHLSPSLKGELIAKFPTLAATLIEKFIPQNVFGWAHLDYEQFGGTILEDYLSSVSIARLKESTGVWSFSETMWIDLTIDEIQAEISRKEGKLREYLTHCDAAWLIIVINSHHFSTTAELPSGIGSHLFNSGFERVYIFDRRGRRTVRLSISKSAG